MKEKRVKILKMKKELQKKVFFQRLIISYNGEQQLCLPIFFAN